MPLIISTDNSFLARSLQYHVSAINTPLLSTHSVLFSIANMAINIPPTDPTSVPDATSDGLSTTTIAQIILGVGIAFFPVMICCICSSTWMTSKLRRRPREEDVVDETSLDDMVRAMFVRRQMGEFNVPTYKEVRLEELDAEGRWMKVQVSARSSTDGQP